MEVVARLRIVDSAGAPVADARAAWLDRAGVIRVLEVEDDGTSPLPADSAEQLFYAGAEGLATAVARLDDAGNDLVLTLETLVDLHGTVRVDGGLPPEPLSIFRWPDQKFLQLSGNRDVWPIQQSVLSGLKLTEDSLETLTTTGGNFVLRRVHPASSGRLVLPNSYRVAANAMDCAAAYQLPDPHILIEATRAPYMFGRVLWADDRSPVEGRVIAHQWATDSTARRSYSIRLLASGQFEIGLSYKHAERPELGLTCSRVTIQFNPSSDSALRQEFAFDVTFGSVPLDVGTLLLERSTPVHVLVTDNAKRPLVGALVESSVTSTHTDENGRATLAADTDDPIRFALPGFTGHSLPVTELSQDPDHPTLVQLDPGVALSISVPCMKQSNSENFITQVATELTDQLFQRASPVGHEQFVDQLFLSPGSRYVEIGWNHGARARQLAFRASRAPAILAGLTPGYAFDLRLLDRFRRDLATEHVRLPLEPGIAEVQLVPKGWGSIELLVNDEFGQPIEQAQIEFSASYLPNYSEQVPGGRSTLAPLALGELTLRVLAEGFDPQVVQLMVGELAQERTVTLSATTDK